MKREWTLHCGLAPFIAADGRKVGSYQAVIDGKGFASVTFYDGKPNSLASVEARVCLGEFLAEARALYDKTEPVRFSPRGAGINYQHAIA